MRQLGVPGRSLGFFGQGHRTGAANRTASDRDSHYLLQVTVTVPPTGPAYELKSSES